MGPDLSVYSRIGNVTSPMEYAQQFNNIRAQQDAARMRELQYQAYVKAQREQENDQQLFGQIAQKDPTQVTLQDLAGLSDAGRQRAIQSLAQAQQWQQTNAFRNALKDAYTTPETQAVSQFGGPTIKAAQALQSGQMQGGFDRQAFRQRALAQGADPMAVEQYLSSLDPAPIKLSEGETLYSRDKMGNYKPIALGNTKNPNEIKEYEYAVSQGYKGSYNDWSLERRRAGATNVSVNTGEKALWGDLGKGTAERVNQALQQADAANQTIYRLASLQDALKDPSLAGPGADIRVGLSRVGRLIGAGGKDDAETLANTTRIIQQLAQLEMQAAQGMRGQGQITENERKLIKRASAGDINMTVGELKTLADALDKQARFTIRWSQQFTEPARRAAQGSAFAPYLNVQEPPAAPNMAAPSKVVDFGSLK